MRKVMKMDRREFVRGVAMISVSAAIGSQAATKIEVHE
jgi:hypothetical protein